MDIIKPRDGGDSEDERWVGWSRVQRGCLPPLHLRESQIFDVLYQTWRNHPPLSYKILEVFARGVFSQDERALDLKGQSGHRAYFRTMCSGRE